MGTPRAQEGRPLVHLIAGLGAGGTESFLLRLLTCDELLRRRSRIVSLRRNDDLAASFRELGVPVDYRPIEASFAGIGNMLRLVRDLARADVALVQSWLYLSDAVASIVAKGLLGKPVVWGLRSSHGGEGKRATRFIARRLNPWLSSRFVDVIAVCGARAGAAHGGFGYATDRMRVIHNGFDLHRFGRDAHAGARVRASTGLAADDFVVGMMARFEIYKDHATLFAAVASLRSSIPRLRVLLAGNGMEPDNERLAELMRRYGVQDIVRLLGLRRDVAAVYSAMDLHVLSSLTEGFPNVVAESVLCGCGSISTDVGEAREIVPDPSWIVAPGDERALAAAIERFHALTADERRAIVASNDAWVRSHFDIEAVAQTYLALYRTLARIDGSSPT